MAREERPLGSRIGSTVPAWLQLNECTTKQESAEYCALVASFPRGLWPDLLRRLVGESMELEDDGVPRRCGGEAALTGRFGPP
jgi:hypothetical protein